MFLYDTNETMKMLGQQSAAEIIGTGGIAAGDFQNVIAAHLINGRTNYFEVGMDAFMLGYIYGKRAERAKRK